MASLVEELILTLEQEDAIYKDLIPVALEKKNIIIKNDLSALQQITEQEQLAVQQIQILERKREKIMTDIGVVLNIDAHFLNIKKMTQILAQQPKEKKKLCIVHDSLKNSVMALTDINKHNKQLIEQSLEMLAFNMNLIQSIRTIPGNNYTKSASSFDMPVAPKGLFDAKQ